MDDDEVDMDFDVDKMLEEKRILEEKLSAKEKEVKELISTKDNFDVLKGDFNKLKETISGFNTSEILGKLGTLQSTIDSETKKVAVQQQKIAELVASSTKSQTGNFLFTITYL